MANMYVKRCSTSLVSGEVQMKATMRYQFKPTKMARIKKIITRVVENVERLELSYTAGRNVKCLQLLWKNLAVPQKLKDRVNL